MRESPSTETITFFLNGERVDIADMPPTTTLLEWLRARGLTGAKEGCAEGDCGACTVAVRRPDGAGLATRAVNACIMALPMAHGADIVTIEGIAADGAPHPIQREMADRHASQCGFCTPGIVMALWSREAGAPADRQAVEDRLAGNLCRCTGYGPILEAAEASAAAADALGDPVADAARADALAAIPPLDYRADDRRFLAPDTEAAFADALADAPDATILSGATDFGLWITKRLFDPPMILSTARLDALKTIEREGDQLVVGAALPLAAFAAAVLAPWPQLGEMMRRFGGMQVRNAGTVGGNIANGSPIGDLPPALIAAGATLELGHRDGPRRLPLEEYFIAYGQQDRQPGEYVRRVLIPLAGLDRLSCHKVSKRFDSDITAILGCFALTLEVGVVAEARLAFGGMAGTPKRALATEAALVGKIYDRESVASAASALAEDFQPMSDQRASAAYRLAVAKNLLMRDVVERTAPETVTRLAGRAAERIGA
ncbi:xanthine dehydrogenase small subunit [Acuticoccus sp. M5D2P5]|uniref:xanthine dehydrogenase small subunit n=1 Tax=Acuticoccus kalidii TaxID=2910977 RepID=UPI001F474C96|nr:xanthine dehydrogenase small subunit [Acuticoccus kalidii]MCF3933562.1 xanthine dehydrogenase small subunit [Acuticoccus kalidii]